MKDQLVIETAMITQEENTTEIMIANRRDGARYTKCFFSNLCS